MDLPIRSPIKLATPADWIRIALLAAAYFCAGKIGLQLAVLNESATPVWPPTGIALAAVLLLGRRIWPGIWLGAFLVNMTTAGSVAMNMGIATGNTLEALIAGWLIDRFAGGRRVFEHAGHILRYLVLAAVLSTAVSATLGVASLALDGLAGDALSVWLTWWLGDMVSAIVVAPFILIWSTRPMPRWEPRRAAEAGLMLLSVVGVGLVVFGDLLHSPFDKYPWSFLCLPPLLWASLRFAQRGAIVAAVALAVVALWGNLRGSGPFVVAGVHESLLLLQAFIGTATVTSLVLGAVVFERRRTEAALRADLAERKQVQRRIAGNLAISRILAEAPSVRAAVPKVLQTIGETFDWQVGAAWTPDLDAHVLRCISVWNAPSAEVQEFVAETQSRTFAPGVGIPGRVWMNLQPAWVPDVVRDLNFPRAPFAVAAGLHAGFAFPIVAGERLLAVMEFFSPRIREPDEALLALFRSMGSQFGQFMERKQTEEALRSKETQLRVVTEITPVMLTQCSRELRYLFVNRAYAEMLALPPERIVGRTIADVLGNEALEAIRPHIENVLQGRLVEYEAEIPFARIGPRILRAAYMPDRDERGEVRGWVASLSDVTEHKRAEQARLESEERFRILADAAPVLIWMSGTDKNRDYFNKRWLEFTGRSPEEEIGNGWAENIHPDDLDYCVQTYTQSFDARREFEMEYRLRRHDGEYRWLIDRGIPRFAGPGTFVGFIGSCIDITERRKAQAELEAWQAQLEARVQQRTAELAAAHQRLRAEIDERRHLETELARASEREQLRLGQELHEGLGQELAGMSLLMATLQSKIERLSPDLAAETRELRTMFQQSVGKARAMAEEFYPMGLERYGLRQALLVLADETGRRHEVNSTVKADNRDGDLDLKDASAIQLFRIAQEAVRNAARHSQAKNIEIGLAVNPGHVTITIQDDGVGLRDDRANAPGMGLRIMRYRAQMIGGDLDVRNDPNGGVVVTCSVPN